MGKHINAHAPPPGAHRPQSTDVRPRLAQTGPHAQSNLRRLYDAGPGGEGVGGGDALRP